VTTLGQLTLNSSYDDVAQALIGECARRGYGRDEAIGVTADGIQESALRPRAHNPAGPWDGIYQQDGSYPGRFDANTQITGFLDRLDDKRKSPGHGDIWLNIFWLQQRPGEKTAADAYAHGRQAYLTEIKSRTAEATRLVDLYWPANGGVPPVPDNRPDFNEYPMWSANSQDRAGTKIDLWLIHTQEGPGNADSLAKYLQGNQVSYHYTISEDPTDHGVTVVDVVDTDEASWSVLSANNRSINLCFAGSSVSWTRDQWLAQSRAIDVAAYLAVQDCKKYGIGTKVVPPPYTTGTPGISDHQYVTQVLKDGTHTDVGPTFPWDVFGAAVNKYATGASDPQPEPAAPNPPVPAPLSDRDLAQQTWDQLRVEWPQLGGQTLVNALAEVRDKVCGTTDKDKH
jgi:N-acetyl-anhydromuramyl-L-alanine amidase AmpD